MYRHTSSRPWMVTLRGIHSKLSPLISSSSSSPQHGLGPWVQKGPGGRSSVDGLTVTVFGCTGFLGRYMVNRLAKQGVRVILPYRGEQADYQHLKVMGDLGRLISMPFHLNDEISIRKAIRHSDVVVNLIGRDYETKNFSWSNVHVEGAQRIARIAYEEGVPRFIHVSALNSNLESRSRFFQSKAEGELTVKQAFPQVTIIRPATLYGFEDRFFNRMTWFSSLPFGFPLYNHGKQKIRPVYVVDVATALFRIIHTNESMGHVYEFYGPKEYRYIDLVNYFEKFTHKRINRIHLPKFMFHLFGRIMSLSPRSRLEPDEVIRLGIDDQVSDGNILTFNDLDIQSTPLEKVAIQFLRAHRGSIYYDEPISDSDYYGPPSSPSS